MAEFVFILFFAIPAILGLAEILHTARLWILSGKDKGEKMLILGPENENFHNQILKTYEEARWQGEKLAKKIIVVDSCLSEENKKECEKLVQRLGLTMFSRSQLFDIL